VQEKLLAASSSVQQLDEEVSKQLHNIRADVKQAITVAAKSLRADLEAAAHARQQEDTTQLKEQLRSELRWLVVLTWQIRSLLFRLTTSCMTANRQLSCTTGYSAQGGTLLAPHTVVVFPVLLQGLQLTHSWPRRKTLLCMCLCCPCRSDI
jgi:hypothetical protein